MMKRLLIQFARLQFMDIAAKSVRTTTHTVTAPRTTTSITLQYPTLRPTLARSQPGVTFVQSTYATQIKIFTT